MGSPTNTQNAQIEFRVGDGDDLGAHVHNLNWTSFVNRGYTVKVVVLDPNFNILKRSMQGGDKPNHLKYLKEARKKIVPIRFRLKKSENASDDEQTDEHVAYLTDMQSTGKGADARTIFIGIDPLSFLLSRGNASGKYYEGCVSEVITQVVNEYSSQPHGPGVTVNVSKTSDSKSNRWHMYRQDPKTFIKSLLDWSSSTTKKRSRWVVSSGWDADNSRPRINIKEEADLETMDLGVYTVFNTNSDPRQVRSWFLSMNNFTVAFQARMATGGISATSGRYIDPVAIRNKSTVWDNNTGNKLNVDYGSSEMSSGADRAFTKPSDVDWGTHIMSVPEFSGGNTGLKYEDYIDGRARQKFMNLLGTSMNVTIDTICDPLVQYSEKLGAMTCTLHWEDADIGFYFMHGKWLVNGFEHYYNRDDGWRTKLSMYRIDWDSSSRKI